MNRLRTWIFPAVVVGLLVAGFGWLFSVRLASGDVYPYYSSLRADALGTRALHDALARIPGLVVERDYHVLSQLPPRAQTVFIVGVPRQEWESLTVAEFRALRAAVQNGARVVVAFPASVMSEVTTPRPETEAPKKAESEKSATTPAPEAKTAPADPVAAKPEKSEKPAKKKKKVLRRDEADQEMKTLVAEWGVGLKQRWLFPATPAAERTAVAPAVLPEYVTWHSDVYFDLGKETPWQIIYRRAQEPVLIEKTIGRGSIVLMADAFCLSNEAMQQARAPELLAWLVGLNREIVFHEGVLGVLEDNGLGALARRYGLGGAFALAGLVGALYAWRRVVAFRPLPDEVRANGEIALAHDPAAGLSSLLRRALRGPDLLAACVAEWRKSRRGPSPGEDRLAAAWQADSSGTRPVETYNELVRSLKAR